MRSNSESFREVRGSAEIRGITFGSFRIEQLSRRGRSDPLKSQRSGNSPINRGGTASKFALGQFFLSEGFFGVES